MRKWAVKYLAKCVHPQWLKLGEVPEWYWLRAAVEYSGTTEVMGVILFDSEEVAERVGITFWDRQDEDGRYFKVLEVCVETVEIPDIAAVKPEPTLLKYLKLRQLNQNRQGDTNERE